MVNQYTCMPVPDKKELQDMYDVGYTQREIGLEFGVTQKVVWQWFKKLGIKSRVPRNTKQNGADNPSWKGDDAGYAAMHYRLKKERGLANRCEVCNDGQYFEWANLTGDYGNVNDYKMMCKSCHAKYDNKVMNFQKEGI